MLLRAAPSSNSPFPRAGSMRLLEGIHLTLHKPVVWGNICYFANQIVNLSSWGMFLWFWLGTFLLAEGQVTIPSCTRLLHHIIPTDCVPYLFKQDYLKKNLKT